MIRQQFTEFFQANYQAISQYIHSFALQYLNPRHELFDDVVAEGWYITIQKLKSYDPKRSIKWTTYLWPYLLYGMYSYLNKLHLHQQEAKILQHCGYEETFDHNAYRAIASVFESDPFRLMPDEIYENKECIDLWQKIQHHSQTDVQICLAVAPKHLPNDARKRISRRRLEAKKNIRRTLWYLYPSRISAYRG